MWSLSTKLFLLSVAIFALPLCAEESKQPPLTLAVLDYDKILTHAPGFVQAKEVFEKKRAQFYKELGDLELRLSKENKKLVTLQKSDPVAFAKTKEKFEADLRGAHEKLHDRKKALLSIAEKEQAKAQKSFQEALKKVTSENKIQLVLSKSMGGAPVVLFHTKPLDITPMVLTEMRAQKKSHVSAKLRKKDAVDAK